MLPRKIELRGAIAAACLLLATTLPASATSLDPIGYVTHLCLSDLGCSDPNAGTEASGTGGGAIGSSVSSPRERAAVHPARNRMCSRQHLPRADPSMHAQIFCINILLKFLGPERM